MPPAHGSGVAQAPAAPVIVADQGDVNANLQQMTLELRRFVVSTRSVPKDFDDFVARSHAQFPPAPAGKKYRIQDQAIVLVNR